MPPKELKTLQVLIFGRSDTERVYYAFSNQHSNDIKIDYFLCPENIFGRWVAVEIDETDLRCFTFLSIIPDVYGTRCYQNLVEVNVELKYARTESKNGLDLFKHNFFGNVLDSNRILFNAQVGNTYSRWIMPVKREELFCRWQLAPKLRTLPFCTWQNNSHTPPHEELENMNGFVLHSGVNCYMVWSKSRPEVTICLDSRFCPTGIDLIGYSINMDVNKRNEVQEEVTFNRSLLESRLNEGRAEFLAVLQGATEGPDGWDAYHTESFGYVSDCYSVVKSIAKNSPYFTGWVRYEPRYGSKVPWVISPDQDISDLHFEAANQPREEPQLGSHLAPPVLHNLLSFASISVAPNSSDFLQPYSTPSKSEVDRKNEELQKMCVPKKDPMKVNRSTSQWAAASEPNPVEHSRALYNIDASGSSNRFDEMQEPEASSLLPSTTECVLTEEQTKILHKPKKQFAQMKEVLKNLLQHGEVRSATMLENYVCDEDNANIVGKGFLQ